jgi:hypothetical protein
LVEHLTVVVCSHQSVASSILAGPILYEVFLQIYDYVFVEIFTLAI